MIRSLLIVLLMVSSNAFSSGQWTQLNPDDYVLWPGVYTSDLIRLQLKAEVGSNLIDPDGCAVETANSYYLLPTLSEAVLNRTYSLLLATKMAKQPVNIFITGCESGMPAIQSVQF